MDSPKCSNIDIDLYVRMPANPPIVNPRVETSLKLCEEEYANLEPVSSVIHNWHPHQDE